MGSAVPLRHRLQCEACDIVEILYLMETNEYTVLTILIFADTGLCDVTGAGHPADGMRTGPPTPLETEATIYF
jgi:hypothetical protein